MLSKLGADVISGDAQAVVTAAGEDEPHLGHVDEAAVAGDPSEDPST